MTDPVQRMRTALGGHKGIAEKKMFGGVCFMLHDHMLCGTGKPGFMFRVGRDHEAEALARPGARLMNFNGRRMRGFVWVDPTYCDARTLRRWVALAERYVAALPPKPISK
jgi:hypothetical protein